MGEYYRKVIHIAAEDSPNVQLGLRERALGLEPSGTLVLPGVLPWADYVKRRLRWDPIRQCIGLDGRFYKGAELLLYPPQWLDNSEQVDKTLIGARRRALGIGVDTGENVAETSITVVDEYGVLFQWSEVIQDTNRTHSKVLDVMGAYDVPSDRVVFDRGGGGLQITQRMRGMGYPVRTVAFGEAVTPELRRRSPVVKKRIEEKEERYIYMNRRAQMYGELSELLDPNNHVVATTTGVIRGFGIPAAYRELRRQLAPIPKTYDKEGRLFVLPKNNRDPNSKRPTLTELIGCSPDRADSLALACHAMLHRQVKVRAGAY